MAPTADRSAEPARHVIKRYAGARLYDTTTLAYVTRDQLRALLRTDADVVIYEAEDGSDITEKVLGNA